MKKLSITKEQFEKSRYFKNKYGKLEYVSESGKVFKTSKGKLLKFKESTKKLGKKFTKENVEAPDDDLTCPECGGTNVYSDDGYATCGDCEYSWEIKDYTKESSDSFWHEYETEMAKYLKKLDKDLYEACTMTAEGRGPTFSREKREWNWDFWSAQNKALDAVAEEIADEVGGEITIVDDVVEYTTGKDLAHRVVDYILTEKPSKLLARKLAKIGY